MDKSNQPIRIAQVIGKLSSAGVEAVVNNYYRHLDHNQFQFDYYIDDDSECQPPQEMLDLGARYYVIPGSKHIGARIKALKKAFKQNRYPIVHSHMNALNAPVLYAAYKSNVPVRISHSHSTGSSKEGIRNVIKCILRHTGSWFATDRMACGEAAARWLFGNREFEKGNVFILPNAIDVDKYRFRPEVRQRIRQELHIAEDQLVIGHVGRFMKQKNHEFLIRIFAELKQKEPKALLLLIGDGELKPKIEQQTRSLKLSDSVLFLGNRKDVDQLYNAMDVFALPSLYEGVPVVLIEAQTNGLPCVVSASISAETPHGDSLQFVPLAKNEQQWADCLLKKQNKENRKEAYHGFVGTALDIAYFADRMQMFYSEAQRLEGLCKGTRITNAGE